MIKKVIWIVLDSVGMGNAPDAEAFGDTGANTIAHTAKACGGLQLYNLRRLGYGNIDGMQGGGVSDWCLWKITGAFKGKGYYDWTLGNDRN